MMALKQVLSIYNVHPVSNFAPSGNPAKQSQTPSRKTGRNAVPGPRPKAENKDPEVVALKAHLQKIQELIKDESPKFPGGILPKDHPVIRERDSTLQQIVVAKSSFRGSKSLDRTIVASSPQKGEEKATQISTSPEAIVEKETP